MKIYFEKMDKKHICQVLDIEQKSFSDPWTEGMFENELANENARYRVVTDGITVIGYSGFWKILDEGHIMNVAVHPQYRGRHFGDVLIQGMIEEAKRLNINFLTLEVREGNLTAISLYKKYGFTEEGLRKGYYSDNGENAVVMWAEI